MIYEVARDWENEVTYIVRVHKVDISEVNDLLYTASGRADWFFIPLPSERQQKYFKISFLFWEGSSNFPYWEKFLPAHRQTKSSDNKDRFWTSWKVTVQETLLMLCRTERDGLIRFFACQRPNKTPEFGQQFIELPDK